MTRYRRWPSYQAWRAKSPGTKNSLTIHANEMFTVGGTPFMLDDDGNVVRWVPAAFRKAFEAKP